MSKTPEWIDNEAYQVNMDEFILLEEWIKQESIENDLLLKLIDLADEKYNCPIYVSDQLDSRAVFSVDEDDHSLYFVHIRPDTPVNTMWQLLAHEIGHCQDYIHNYQCDFDDWRQNKHESKITELEQQAWLYAVAILKSIKDFTQSEWWEFYKYYRACLQSYHALSTSDISLIPHNAEFLRRTGKWD